MNLFYLDTNPKTAAQMHHDKHVVKMILETAQMLSTAHRYLDGELYIELSKNKRKIKRYRTDEYDDVLYKATHVNHPSSKWIRESSENYIWAYTLFIELCKEYTHRYGKTHKSQTLLENVLCRVPKNIKRGGLTKMPQAMPDEYKTECSVQAYRNYYINTKKHQSKYTKRRAPDWLNK